MLIPCLICEIVTCNGKGSISAGDSSKLILRLAPINASVVFFTGMHSSKEEQGTTWKENPMRLQTKQGKTLNILTKENFGDRCSAFFSLLRTAQISDELKYLDQRNYYFFKYGFIMFI